MRLVAVAAALAMLALGMLEGTSLAIALIVIASVATVADNTGHHLASAAVPPLIGAAVTGHGYGFAFGIVALFPLIAIPLIPVKGEKPDPNTPLRATGSDIAPTCEDGV